MKKPRNAKRKTPPGSSTPRRPDRDRRVRQHERISRVLRLLNLIQSRGRWNAKSIADELHCSERTVYRDLEVLEFAGVPWYFDEDEQCYHVRPDFRFPTLTLTEEEAIGQAVATNLGSFPGLDISTGAKPTTRKLTSASSEEIQRIVADAQQLIEVLDLKLADHSKHHDAIRLIQAALLQRKQIVGVYESPYEDKSKKLKIHPFRLCLIQQAWYLVGRIEGETEAKTFRVARFNVIRMTQQAAEIPEGFNLRQHFGNAWGVYRGNPSYQVQLRFEPEAAKLVTETIWHHTQKVKKLPKGRVQLTFQVDGLYEISHWILSWSGHVKVVAPDELKVLMMKTWEDAIQRNAQA